MTALDTINCNHGWHTLRYASRALSSDWQMRQQLKSPLRRQGERVWRLLRYKLLNKKVQH
jgi:Domain of unknown function (DUF4113)